MTDKLARSAQVEAALGALHRMSVSAGEHGLYANEAALHRIYTQLDESFAALEAELAASRRATNEYANALADRGLL